jgi:hypothetical protein
VLFCKKDKIIAVQLLRVKGGFLNTQSAFYWYQAEQSTLIVITGCFWVFINPWSIDTNINANYYELPWSM